jgi:hypothetical protein
MNNNDERDYEEEQFNRHLLDDETDPEDERDTPRLDALLSSENPEGEYYEENYTPHQFRPPGEGEYTRAGHRAQALHLAGMADRSDPEFAPGLGFAAVTHAVLALSAPARPEEGTWRQRAVEAEAALTTIGSVLANPGYPGNKLEEVERILRVSGQQADKLMNAPAGPGAELTPAETDALVVMAAERIEPDDPSLSGRERKILTKAQAVYRRVYADDDDSPFA